MVEDEIAPQGWSLPTGEYVDVCDVCGDGLAEYTHGKMESFHIRSRGHMNPDATYSLQICLKKWPGSDSTFSGEFLGSAIKERIRQDMDGNYEPESHILYPTSIHQCCSEGTTSGGTYVESIYYQILESNDRRVQAFIDAHADDPFFKK